MKKVPFLRNYIGVEEMRITEYRLYKLQLNYYLSFIFMTFARKIAFLDSKTDNLTDRQAQHNYMTDKLLTNNQLLSAAPISCAFDFLPGAAGGIYPAIRQLIPSIVFPFSCLIK